VEIILSGIDSGRINLTIGWLTTSQTLEYVPITMAIISEWKLHPKVLNFVMSPWLCSENAVREAVSRNLPKWNV
jgi:hypothetical protein